MRYDIMPKRVTISRMGNDDLSAYRRIPPSNYATHLGCTKYELKPVSYEVSIRVNVSVRGKLMLEVVSGLMLGESQGESGRVRVNVR